MDKKKKRWIPYEEWVGGGLPIDRTAYQSQYQDMRREHRKEQKKIQEQEEHSRALENPLNQALTRMEEDEN